MTSIETDTDIRDITIIGAGPVGLCTAFWAGMREASARIIDSLPEIGGQLTTLYPEKWIFDVPGHPRVLARDLVAQLREQIEPFEVPIHLEVTAESISYEGEGDDRVVVLHTTDGQELRSRTVIVSGGHGAFEPKKLPISDVDMEPWEGKGVHYLVGDKHEFTNKRVLIVGGGDSACDWVLNLLDTAEHITLVHRRDAFRAHEATVSQVREAAGGPHVDLHTPYVVKEVTGNGKVQGVVLHNVAEEDPHSFAIECDAILLQLGFSTKLGPLKEWGFELDKNAIKVDQTFGTSLERVWACGDITTFDGKIKLIATGFGEAAIAVAQAVQTIRPDMKLQPAYSTNTGVPGGVAGQP
jgi:ferredoxin/flavodoxin---NADP+ reductase